MEFKPNCSILNVEVIYIEKLKLKIADMWFINCVTHTMYVAFSDYVQ